MTIWLERARREIPKPLDQGAAKTDETWVLAATAAFHPEESEISRGSNGSNGSTTPAVIAHAPDPLPSLPPAAEARRQKVLALLARDGGRYAVYVEDPNTAPVIMALATPDGTCEVLIPRNRYDPFAVLDIVKGWEREDLELEPLWWRVAITEPDGRTVEVDSPSGWTLPEWQAYAERYHGPGCAVTPIAGLPKPSRAPVNLEEALRAACEGVGGITPEVFRCLLSPEDLADIEAGALHRKTLRAYAQSFAEGIRSKRVAALPERKGAKPAPLWGSVAITEAEIEAVRKGRLVVRQGAFSGKPLPSAVPGASVVCVASTSPEPGGSNATGWGRTRTGGA